LHPPPWAADPATASAADPWFDPRQGRWQEPEPEQQRHVDMIRDYKGADFDRMFMKHMVDGHEKGVKLYTRAGTELKNEMLKGFAEKTLPTLKDHLDMAKKIQERLDKK